MSEALRGRVALVTGAGSGLGAEIARRLADAGCALAVHHATSAEGAREVVRAARAGGVEAATVAADLRVADARAGLVAEVEARLGPVDLLVNNAATTRFVPFDDLTAADDEVWRELLEVNLLAAVALTRAVWPGMVERGFGRILNVASTSALEPEGSSMPYAVSKSALVAYTRALAAVAPAGVTVNAVAPGWLQTSWATRRGGRPPADDQVEAAVPDVADAAVALLANPSVHGEVVVVDGGARWRRRHG